MRLSISCSTVGKILFGLFNAGPGSFLISEQQLLSRVFHSANERRVLMKKIALGVIAAASIMTAVPAMAQVGFYAGPGGVGVGVGVPGPYYNSGPYYNCGYPNRPCDRGYYDYYSGPSVG